MHQVATSIKLRPAARHHRRPGRGPERAGPDRGAVPRADAAGHHRRAVRRAGGARPARAGPARRRRRLRPLRRHARALRRARGRRRPGRPRRRADRGPVRRPGGRCVDEQPEAGGVAARQPPTRIDGAPALDWVAAAVAELADLPEVRRPAAHHGLRPLRRRLRPRARAAHRPPRRRRTRAPVPAAGLADPGPAGRRRHRRARAPDRVRRQRPPGHHARRRAPAPTCTATACWSGARAVVFTTNDSAYAAAVDLADAGRARSPPSSTPGRRRRRWARECERRGIAVRTGQVVTGTERRRASTGRTSPCVDGGSATAAASAATCCWSAAAGTPRCTCSARPAAGCATTTRSAAFVPGDAPGRVERRRRGRRACSTWRAASRDGAAAARRGRCGLRARRAGRRTPAARRGAARPSPPLVLWSVPDPPADAAARSSSTCSATRRSPTSPRAVGAGLRSVEHVKRYTTIGTAHDQGKTSGRHRLRHHRRAARRADRRRSGTTTFRPPYTPVSFAALAGRDRGRAVRPRAGHRRCTTGTSRTARCSRTSGSGSGRGTTRGRARTWRPPCCASARRRAAVVGMLDGSTLGKIDVQGPDAGRAPRPALHQPDRAA